MQEQAVLHACKIYRRGAELSGVQTIVANHAYGERATSGRRLLGQARAAWRSVLAMPAVHMAQHGGESMPTMAA